MTLLQKQMGKDFLGWPFFYDDRYKKSVWIYGTAMINITGCCFSLYDYHAFQLVTGLLEKFFTSVRDDLSSASFTMIRAIRVVKKSWCQLRMSARITPVAEAINITVQSVFGIGLPFFVWCKLSWPCDYPWLKSVKCCCLLQNIFNPSLLRLNILEL